MPSPLMACMYCIFDVLYGSFGIACLTYHTAITFALYQPLYPEFIVNSFDIKRAAATFGQFAYTLNGKHKYVLICSGGATMLLVSKCKCELFEIRR